jgi:hypothetical protein
VKLARAKMKLASMEAGGSPERPIEVSSASVVEPHASGTPCAACGAPSVRVEEHVAVTMAARGSNDARPLRVARVACARCGARREIWYRLGTPLPS